MNRTSPKSSPRIAAAQLLIAVLERGRALEDALGVPAYAALEGRDRAFARAMTTAALRRLGGLDAILQRFLQKPIGETSAEARALLRLGAAQMLVLDTPAHAAVGETVDAAHALAPPMAKLINAVLRKVSEQKAAFDELPPGADLPPWLFTRWRAAYRDQANDIANALTAEAPLDLTVKSKAKEWADTLIGDVTPTGSVRLAPGHGPIDQLPGFAEGAWWVQDAAAALPARLLGNVRGRKVLDLCAAPGGKTMQLAHAGAFVTAVDKSEARLELLQQNLERTKLDAVAIARDALTLKAKEKFDAVLLDAPCTATGTLRRHPDVAWLRRPDDVRSLTEVQRDLLHAAAGFVRIGGRVVYAVCSLEPEEGTGVIAEALKTGIWRREPLEPGEIPGCDDFINRDGDLRTLPSYWPERGGLDGFYAARLVRV